ncbi:unnamed protein product [Rangifer tarandus platyrhynchus]|uniref:Uncharacterized protein n=1 Tax=Rangifer tarandus platyrhynchus TaxID=3082113 RepID=A0ABN8YP14_RANTA|nr:unnamed protein product [Rangifer tarandus platyrhynchus]
MFFPSKSLEIPSLSNSVCVPPSSIHLIFIANSIHSAVSLSSPSLSICLQIHYPTHAAAKSLQSCLSLCNPTDSSPPGSPVPGILQARTVEWVAISFSNT